MRCAQEDTRAGEGCSSSARAGAHNRQQPSPEGVGVAPKCLFEVAGQLQEQAAAQGLPHCLCCCCLRFLGALLLLLAMMIPLHVRRRWAVSLLLRLPTPAGCRLRLLPPHMQRGCAVGRQAGWDEVGWVAHCVASSFFRVTRPADLV